MDQRIPSNIIIKSIYNLTRPALCPRYIPSVINDIINYIYKTQPNYYDNLEIEAKLGHYEFKGNKIIGYHFINEPFRIPDFIKSPTEYGFNFKSGISPDHFYLIWSAVDQEAKNPSAGIIPLGTFTYKETHYKSGKRRSCEYRDGKLVGEAIIRKEEKRNFNIRNCGNDFRITCSKEMPTDILEGEDIVEMERNKFRVSYQFSFYRIDFTITTSSNESFPSYEVELEINKLKELLKENNGAVDFGIISTILERFMQNIINLYTAISPETYSTILSKNDNPFKSKMGNYLEFNVKKE